MGRWEVGVRGMAVVVSPQPALGKMQRVTFLPKQQRCAECLLRSQKKCVSLLHCCGFEGEKVASLLVELSL